MSSKKTYVLTRSRLEACSTEEGIFISVSAFDGEQPMCGYVFRNADGTIEKKTYYQSIIAQYNDWKKANSIEKEYVEKKSKLINLIITLLLGALIFLGNNILTCFSVVLWIVLFFTNGLSIISYFIATAMYHKKFPKLSMYHGAEHKAIIAYDRYKRIPTIEEISKETIYDNNCSSIDYSLKPVVLCMLNAIILTVSIVAGGYFFLYCINSWQDDWKYMLFIMIMTYVRILYFLITVITDRLVSKGFDSGLLTHLTQWTVVKEPTYQEIEVAHEALKLREEIDQMVKEHEDDFTIVNLQFDVKEKRAIYTFCNGRDAKITINEYLAQIRTLRDAEEVDYDEVKKDKNHEYIFLDSDEDDDNLKAIKTSECDKP